MRLFNCYTAKRKQKTYQTAPTGRETTQQSFSTSKSGCSVRIGQNDCRGRRNNYFLGKWGSITAYFSKFAKWGLDYMLWL